MVRIATPTRPTRSLRVRPARILYLPVITVSSSEYAGAQQHSSTSWPGPVFQSLWGVPGAIVTQSPTPISDSCSPSRIRPSPATK